MRGIEETGRVQEEGLLTMGPPVDPAARPSRLAPLAHLAVLLLLSLSFLSGLAVWRGQALLPQLSDTPGWLPALLRLHGCLSPFLCALFGSLCCQHIRLGWQLKANLATGFSLEIVFAGLILSGAGLYYLGSADCRNASLWTHRLLGLLLPLSLGAHWTAGL